MIATAYLKSSGAQAPLIPSYHPIQTSLEHPKRLLVTTLYDLTTRLSPNFEMANTAMVRTDHSRPNRIISAMSKANDRPTEEELNGEWTIVEKVSGPPTCSFHGQIQCQRNNSGDKSVSQPSISTVAASKRGSQEMDGLHRQKKLRLFNSLGDVVNIRVGLDGITFSVHRHVLLSASPVLSGKCTPFGSIINLMLVLDNECPDTIQSLCYWMYYNEICISQTISQRSNNLDPLNTAPGLFIKLYIAATKFSMPRLCNDAIDALLCHAKTIDLISLSTHVYAHTYPESRLRKLLVKVVSYKCDSDDLVKQKELICTEFLFDLAKAAFTDRDQGFNRFRDRLPPQEGFCPAFHVHERDELRCEMMKGFVVADEERP